MKMLYFLLIFTLSEALQNNWVDPHDMNIKAKKKYQRSFSDASQDSVSRDGKSLESTSAEETMSLIYLKRTVSLILSSASPEDDNSNVYTGSYRYALDSEEYKFLTDFTMNDKINTEDIRRLDTVLSTLFSKPYFNSIFSFNMSGGDLINSISSTNFLIAVGIGISLLVFYTLLRSNLGFLYIFFYFLSLIIIVDYGFRYKHLYEEAEEHNLNLVYSKDCDTKSMTWSEYFKFKFSEKNCNKKVVTPLDVALYQLKYLIIIPMESLGTGMGKFGKELWRELPFPWNILIFPIMLIFILIITFILVLAFKGTPIKLSLFHLFNLQLGGDNNQRQGISEETVGKILDATTSHRRMVEDARSSPHRTVPKRIKQKTPSPNKEKLEANNEMETSSDGDNNHPKLKILEKNENQPITFNVSKESEHDEDTNSNKTHDKPTSEADSGEKHEVVNPKADGSETAD